MSSGKANSKSVLNSIRKKFTRSGRVSTSTYARDESAAGGAGGGRGRGGGGGGGVDFDPPPSASGDVAPHLFLEGPSIPQAETESRDESDSDEVEDEEARPKPLRTHGESKVPEWRKEPKTEEAKPRIIPNGKE